MKKPAMDYFLDPNQPLATCSGKECNDDCPQNGILHCHFSGIDLLKFLLAVLPAFVIGGIGIFYLQGWKILVAWILFFISYFGLIEIRVMCSHCPHYAEPGHNLKCWANYGSPKLWRYRPGPMSTTENIIFIGGLTVIVGLPTAVFLLHAEWAILLLFSFALTIAILFMRTTMCAHCINFACPFNGVDSKIKSSFMDMNPSIASAWENDEDS